MSRRGQESLSRVVPVMTGVSPEAAASLNHAPYSRDRSYGMISPAVAERSGFRDVERGLPAHSEQESSARDDAVFPPIAALDRERVGELLISLVPAAALLRHRRPRYTARDYLHAETAEEQFVIDILSDVPTAALDEAWFGGRAARLWMEAPE